VRHPWKPAPDLPVLVTRGEETEAITVEETDRYLLEIEDLAECARSGRAPRVSVSESRGNVATIVALLQSAREGRPVRL
jgi:predicted dehydrogenase